MSYIRSHRMNKEKVQPTYCPAQALLYGYLENLGDLHEKLSMCPGRSGNSPSPRLLEHHFFMADLDPDPF